MVVNSQQMKIDSVNLTGNQSPINGSLPIELSTPISKEVIEDCNKNVRMCNVQVTEKDKELSLHPSVILSLP